MILFILIRPALCYMQTTKTQIWSVSLLFAACSSDNVTPIIAISKISTLASFWSKAGWFMSPVFLFSILRMGTGFFELGKISVWSTNLRKVEDYEKCNTFLQTCINLAKLQLCNFEKHWDLILGLHIQKVFSLKNFWSEFSIYLSKFPNWEICVINWE